MKLGPVHTDSALQLTLKLYEKPTKNTSILYNSTMKPLPTIKTAAPMDNMSNLKRNSVYTYDFVKYPHITPGSDNIAHDALRTEANNNPPHYTQNINQHTNYLTQNTNNHIHYPVNNQTLLPNSYRNITDKTLTKSPASSFKRNEATSPGDYNHNDLNIYNHADLRRSADHVSFDEYSCVSITDNLHLDVVSIKSYCTNNSP